MDDNLNLDEKEHATSLLQKLKKMKESEDHCDFVIKIGYHEIPAHKNVLSAGSDYFKAMLSHPTKEVQCGFVALKEMDPDCVVKCIDFIYSGKASASGINLEQLMHVAHVMQLEKLCKNISRFLETNLDSETFFTAKRLANMYDCKRLEVECDLFALKYFKRITKVYDFYHLDQEYVLYLVTSDQCRSSESFKCHTLLSWINFDFQMRNDFYQMLIENLNLSAIEPCYMKYLFENDDCFHDALLQFSPVFTESLEKVEAKSYAELEEQSERMIVFDSSAKCLQCFDPYLNDWTRMNNFPETFAQDRFSTVLLDGYIYVLMKSKVAYRLEYIDQNATWKRIGDMIEDHGECPPVATMSGCIYVIGSGCPIPTKLVEKYNPASNEWTKLKDKNIFCRDNAPISIQDNIYSIGGMFPANNNRLKEVEKYNLQTSEWSFVAPMLQGRSSPAVVVWDQKIYALGGWRQSSVEFYELTSNTWTMAKSMAKCRYFCNAFVLDDNIYVVGGINASSIDKLNTEKNCWEPLVIPMEINLDILGAVTFK